MDKKIVIEDVKIRFEEKIWDKIMITEKIKLFKPKYMLKDLEWDNTGIKDRIPYIKFQEVDNNIIEIEAFGGLVREVPIFYKIGNRKLLLADSPDKLISSDYELDEFSIKEFLTFGYVTSDRTLFKHVYQLEAGEKLVYHGKNVIIKTEFLYNKKTNSEKNRYELKNELMEISENIFSDLIKTLGGKTALIPLSAGYDSRFIASMLKIGGFRDVICYSWGEPGNKDIEVSRKIASKLGFKWICVDYCDQRWNKTIHSKWLRGMLIDASKWTSISGAASLPFQDYLRDSDLDLKNCVIIPGHTGDFISGGHIPASVTEKTSKKEIIKFIKNKHYLVGAKFSDEDILTEINNKIDYYLKYIEGYRSIETWEWRERQSKFIVNTNRYYESISLAWSMPLWDYRFIDYWQKVPLSGKINSDLYKEFLEDKIFSQVGVDFELKRDRKTDINVLKKKL